MFRFFYSVRGSLLFFFLQFQLLFLDFYHFHHVIWGMKWARKVKTKNGQNMSSGLFSHDAAHLSFGRYFLQVAGCRLQFHYNWKTAGTKKKGKAIDLP